MLLALQVRLVAQDEFKKVVGDLNDEATEKVRVVSFKNGQLTVRAPALAAAQLVMQAEKLKKNINLAFGKNLVTKIIWRTS